MKHQEVKEDQLPMRNKRKERFEGKEKDSEKERIKKYNNNKKGESS